MQRWKKILIGVVVLAVVAGVGGPRLYKAFNPAAKKATDELNQRQAAATTVAAPASATSAAAATGRAAGTAAVPSTGGLDGRWTVLATTDVKTLYVGYRVNEVLAGQKVTATGRSPDVTGSLSIAGATVPAAEFTVQVATIKSDKAQRDGQFSGRIMETQQFPTATFKLTVPADFGKVPAGTEKLTATATGDLTLHGVTKSVTFDISGFTNGKQITVAGEIPVLFADYKIANPSFGPIATQDNGAIEFLLVFDRS
jgi:polyisoprenoid-binding protein YceI